MQVSVNRTAVLALTLTVAMLAACSPDGNSPSTTAPQVATTNPQDSVADRASDPAIAEFAAYSEDLMQHMLARDPAWSIYAGRYDDADQVTIPEADRLRTVMARLEQVPAYYQAARGVSGADRSREQMAPDHPVAGTADVVLHRLCRDL